MEEDGQQQICWQAFAPGFLRVVAVCRRISLQASRGEDDGTQTKKGCVDISL